MIDHLTVFVQSGIIYIDFHQCADINIPALISLIYKVFRFLLVFVVFDSFSNISFLSSKQLNLCIKFTTIIGYVVVYLQIETVKDITIKAL